MSSSNFKWCSYAGFRSHVAIDNSSSKTSIGLPSKAAFGSYAVEADDVPSTFHHDSSLYHAWLTRKRGVQEPLKTRQGLWAEQCNPRPIDIKMQELRTYLIMIAYCLESLNATIISTSSCNGVFQVRVSFRHFQLQRRQSIAASISWPRQSTKLWFTVIWNMALQWCVRRLCQMTILFKLLIRGDVLVVTFQTL